MKFTGIVWVLFFVSLAMAQEGTSPDVKKWEESFDYEKVTEAPAETPKVETANTDQLTFQYRMAKQDQRFYTLLLLSITLLLSLLLILFFITRHGTHTMEHIVTASGLPFIIFGVLFLMLLSDTEQQLTAGVGILGAVAGYLFRSMQGETPPKKAEG